MNTDFIKGVVVPILTPIDGDEKIDESKMRDQVDYVIKGGVSGILAFGSNGEFYMVEEDEMERGLKIMVDQAAGRVPVYLRNRRHQHPEVLPSGEDGGCKRRCGNFRASAHVLKAHGDGAVSPL